ncbi:hypothetical protein FIV42_15240 [Persicimonas caeni]|uniref:Uncharacterized protein n=1 Tax=Persicimonas caeni TaxID=2292766 RepID=A0A4Y6PUN2_PERCE|nr:hypothetical protein [Persicimonas caeni]QDG52046.1 hypothetical protein FIV42_15240 [Persicimonas caeni]QED33267.1 hypothetical protein FRD00_15235 [Persicimonas caeni]
MRNVRLYLCSVLFVTVATLVVAASVTPARAEEPSKIKELQAEVERLKTELAQCRKQNHKSSDSDSLSSSDESQRLKKACVNMKLAPKHAKILDLVKIEFKPDDSQCIFVAKAKVAIKHFPFVFAEFDADDIKLDRNISVFNNLKPGDKVRDNFSVEEQTVRIESAPY